MSNNNFTPPRRGTPRRIVGGGTRAQDENKQTPPDPTNPDHSNPSRRS